MFCQEDCEECVNDTWFSAWGKIPPTKPAILSTFLGRITRGLAIDYLRKRCAAKRSDSHFADIEAELETLDRITVHTIEDKIEEKELLNTIKQFLQSLSAPNRDIFLRRYWYADSIKEIAARHQCTPGKVKSSLFRSRKKLEKILNRR